MSVYIQNFVKFKPFLKELVSRDVKVKYRRSILGVLWTLLNPLLMMTVLSKLLCIIDDDRIICCFLKSV